VNTFTSGIGSPVAIAMLSPLPFVCVTQGCHTARCHPQSTAGR
jgi:hypothetical protein